MIQTARLALLLLSIAGLSVVARADVKIKSKSGAAGQSAENITLIKGKRQRTENGPQVTILQCDLRRTLQLSPPTKTYLVSPFGGETAAGAAPKTNAPGQPQGARRGGVVTSTFTSTDTGERKQMFGYTARRIKTSIVTDSTPDACSPNKSRMETDGWYIDAAFALSCDAQAAAAYTPPTQSDGCRDEYRTKQIGSARTGYPVLVTTTLFDEKGQATYTFTNEVLEISQATLDASLFEAPADFREVSSLQELYAPAAAQFDANDAEGNVNGASGPAGAGGAALAGGGAKRAGVVRVGVAILKATGAGNVTTAALADGLRDGFAKQLGGPTVEVAAIVSEYPQQIEDEARRKECDFVLYLVAEHKKGSGGGGGFGGFLKKAAPVIGGGVSDSGTAGGGSGVAGHFKAKDELTLDYTLQRAGASDVAASGALKAKAKRDGEDLITQLVSQAATTLSGKLGAN
jgi:hypothetical protein